MNKYLRILLLILPTGLASHSLTAQEATATHKDSLNVIIKKYYDWNLKIFQTHSTVDQIDKLFDLFTEDFTYIHPKYGGTYTRQDLYDGYVRNQKNGAYNSTIIDIQILNSIAGLNAVVVQKRFVEKNKNPDTAEPEMTLFEFREGKISRIYEYW